MKKGFSLIELVIVIMIIAVLSLIAFGGMKYLQGAKLTATNSKLLALDQMVEQYNNTVGEYPSDLRELVSGPSSPQLARRWQEPIAKDKDLEDGWGRAFVYTRNAKGTRPPYELYSIGAKGTSRILSPLSLES